jgi:alpha-glucoside transport system permease protein
VSGGGSLTAEPPVREAPPSAEPGRLRELAVTLAFLLPAAILLAAWVVYPTVYTVFRSFFDASGDKFVGIDNYKSLFDPALGVRRSIINNIYWVALVPALITAIGLVFAVLTERVRWSVAFKTAVFMPMAISLFAAGVIWRIMDQQEPSRGAVNAVIASAHDAISPPGVLADASPSVPGLTGSASKGLTLQKPLGSGGEALLGLTGIPPEGMPSGAKQAVVPQPGSGKVVGVVWRDFKPGGGTPGKVEQGELGIPGVKVALKDPNGKTFATTSSAADGAFQFDGVQGTGYKASISADTFRKPYGGVAWLGSTTVAPGLKLVTVAVMIAYIWVWAGFAMVVIGAGLAAIPRDVLEASRTDGATEWQVFRRVTVPLLAPVLSVVFITMLINVLKVFDIVLSVAPGSTQTDASVIALAMWRTSFGGVNDFGLGSAIAVFLFILVIPILMLNVRRFKRET